MDPWTGRHLAQARIDALLQEAAAVRLGATARRDPHVIGFVTDHDPARCQLARDASPRPGDDGDALERSRSADPSLWSIGRRAVAGFQRPGR